MKERNATVGTRVVQKQTGYHGIIKQVDSPVTDGLPVDVTFDNGHYEWCSFKELKLESK